MIVRVRFIKEVTKLPYHETLVEGASDADDALSTAQGDPGTDRYEDGDPAETRVVSAYELVGGTVDDAIVAAGDPGSLSAKARRVSSDLGTIKGLLPTSLDTNNLRVAIEKVDATAAIKIAGINKTLLQAAINISSAGDNTDVIAAPGSGLKIKILYLELNETTGADNSVILKSGSTSLNGSGVVIAANGQYRYESPLGLVPLTLNTNEALNINLANATNVSGLAIYYVEA